MRWNGRRARKILKSFVFTSNHTPKRLWNLLVIWLQHQFFKNAKVKGSPVRLVIEPTNYCNLGCPLCPAGKDNSGHERGMMKLEEFRAMIDEVGDTLYEIDLYNFGESLLNKDIYAMIACAAQKKIKTNLSTNLNLGDAEKLVASGLSKLIVSADGASQETYRQYRVYGNFEKVFGKLKEVIAKKKELKSKTPKIVWQFLVMKHNEHEVPQVRQWGRELGIEVDIKPIRLNTAIDKEVAQDNEPLRVRWLPSLDWLRRLSYQKKRPQKPGPKSCLFLWNQAVVNWNGVVTPCCAIFDSAAYPFGHVRNDGGVLKAWNSDTYQRARRMVKKMDAGLESEKKFGMCAGCIKNEFVDI